MSKKYSNDAAFQERFKDRIENMGKDGVMGLIKTAENPIVKGSGGSVGNKLGNWNQMYNEANKSQRKDETSIISSSSRKDSTISSNGMMVMNNQANYMSQNANNPVMFSNGMQQAGNMNMINNPYPYQYNLPNQMYQQQLPMPMQHNMNYGYMPYNTPYNGGMMYNQQMGNYNQPINNFNRNLTGQTDKSMLNMNNSNPHTYHTNQPVRLIHTGNLPTIEEKTYSNQIQTRPQRAISSKIRNDLSNVDNNYSRQRTHSSNNSHFEDGSIYKPYTLKEYKDLSNTKIVLGSLGPNIGTKEWEEKSEKMKKMNEYSEQLNNNKIGIKIKKESAAEIIERKRREQIERSNRFKAYEYGKLVRPKPRTSLPSENSDKFYEDLGVLGGKEEKKFELFTQGRNSESNNNRYNLDDSIESSSKRSVQSKPQVDEVTKLQNQREAYRMKINEIKESLLK